MANAQSGGKDDSKLGPDFGFPYPRPYSIQLDLMKALYQTIDNRQIGIFESPTGTVRG